MTARRWLGDLARLRQKRHKIGGVKSSLPRSRFFSRSHNTPLRDKTKTAVKETRVIRPGYRDYVALFAIFFNWIPKIIVFQSTITCWNSLSYFTIEHRKSSNCRITFIGRFTPVLSIRIVLSCFYLLISHFENFSTWISRLQFAVNAMLNDLNLAINIILSTLFLYGHPVQSIVNWKYEDPENLNVNIIKQSTKLFEKNPLFRIKQPNLSISCQIRWKSW